MANNLDEERVNKLFTIFCYGVLIALVVGVITGAAIVYFIKK